jgi:membrane associated rhomboid family serine protease
MFLRFSACQACSFRNPFQQSLKSFTMQSMSFTIQSKFFTMQSRQSRQYSNGNSNQRQYSNGNSNQRQYFNQKRNSSLVIYSIIGINTAVFLGWIYSQNYLKSFGNPALLVFMQKHFTLGIDSSFVNYVTACFSHSSFIHYGINMYVLYSFGSIMIGILGINQFLTLYAVSGLTSGIFSMIHKHLEFKETGRIPPPSNGASGKSSLMKGCISGVLTIFATMYPFAKITFFIIPMPAYVGIGGIFLYDLYKATKSNQGMTDSAGHVGGGIYDIYIRHWRITILLSCC